MKKTTSLMILIAGLLLAGASPTAAQTPLAGKLFINVSGGGQMSTDTLTTGNSLSIYNQTATWTAAQKIDRGGLFDVSVGYKVWDNLGIAVGFSSFSKTGTAAGIAVVPSPIFFNQPRTTEFNPPAKRSDHNVYIAAVWFVPVMDKIDLAISIGPSFTKVKQELITDITIPTGTSTAVPFLVEQSATAKGVNIGVDGTYLFLKWLGAGAFIRYNGGSVDLGQVADVKAGGLQLGIGARLRF